MPKPSQTRELSKVDPSDVTPADRARHCYSLAERVNATRHTHEKVYEALAFGPDGELDPEMLVMGKEGNARRREVREELKLLDKLDGRSLTLISAAQSMWEAERAEKRAMIADNAGKMDAMTKRMYEATVDKQARMSAAPAEALKQEIEAEDGGYEEWEKLQAEMNAASDPKKGRNRSHDGNGPTRHEQYEERMKTNIRTAREVSGD